MLTTTHAVNHSPEIMREATAAETDRKLRIEQAQRITELNELPKFAALELVTRPNVPTEQAAYYLDRRPQTMRMWAMRGDGPLRPMRINGRLAWPVSELRRVLGVA